MRKNIEYYNSYEITEEIIKRIKLIELKRIQEGITHFSMEDIKTLKELCELHQTNPEQENVILGEDWYIIYTTMGDCEIEINEWVAINSVKNKLTQSIEMFNALKKILIENEQSDIYAILRHSTSYKFYQTLAKRDFIEEFYDIIELEEDSSEIEKIKQKILTDYDSLEDYLIDENRERYEGTHLEDHIYHYVSFGITDEFVNRYKKSGR